MKHKLIPAIVLSSGMIALLTACQNNDLTKNRALLTQSEDSQYLDGADGGNQSPSFSSRPIWVIEKEDPTSTEAQPSDPGLVTDSDQQTPDYLSSLPEFQDYDPLTPPQSPSTPQAPTRREVPRQFVSWFDTDLETDPILSLCRGMQYEGLFSPLVPGPRACEVPQTEDEAGGLIADRDQIFQLPDMIIGGGAEDSFQGLPQDPAAARFSQDLDVLFIIHSGGPLSEVRQEVLQQMRVALGKVPEQLRWTQDQMQRVDLSIGMFLTVGTSAEPRQGAPTHAQLVNGANLRSSDFTVQGASYDQTLSQVDRRLEQFVQQLPAQGSDLISRQGYQGLVDLREVLAQTTPYDQTFLQAGLFRPEATTAVIFITDVPRACGAEDTSTNSGRRLFQRRAQTRAEFCVYDVYMSSGEPLSPEEARGFLQFLTTAP